MEEKTQVYRKTFLIVRLYRDDLEAIGGIVEANFDRCKYETETHELEGLEEFDQLPNTNRPLTHLEVRCHRENSSVSAVWISFDSDEASVRVADEQDSLAMGVAARIEAIIRTRVRWLGYLASPVGRSLTYVLIFLLAFLLGSGIAFGSLWVYAYAVLLVLIGAVAFSASYVDAMRHSLVYMHRRSERPGFLKRNKDKILVQLLVSSVAVVLAFLLGRFSVGTRIGGSEPDVRDSNTSTMVPTTRTAPSGS